MHQVPISTMRGRFVLMLGIAIISGCASMRARATSEGGVASYYAHQYHGRTTANGEIFDMNAMTAAHKTLPFGTRVKVTNLQNGKSVTVRINDRGPFVKGRIIDLSFAAAKRLDIVEAGIARVKLERVSGPADALGSAR